MKIKAIKVTMLNQFIKRYLKSNSIFNNLYVEGEISNIRTSKTGYTYFTLCDDSSCINCICFYRDYLSKDGDKVVVEGELSVYEAKGTYQIIVRNIEKTGLGKTLQELELLKQKLKSKGIFDKNKPLPLYPKKIGIITSKTGAAIQDILKTFESVKGDFDIVIYNVLIQGINSKQNIIDGIKYFNKSRVDLILISRGGGSFEDLNVFNDILIAEETYKSTIPVITGIGHEVDTTITDYVADKYCHTPTAAAEYIIRGYKDVEIKLDNFLSTMKSKINNYHLTKSSHLKTSKYILKSYLPLEDIYIFKNKLEKSKYIIQDKTNEKLNGLRHKLEIINEKFENNNYENQIKKGFSIVTNQNGEIIRNISQAHEKDVLNIIFSDFIIKAETISIKEVKNDG